MHEFWAGYAEHAVGVSAYLFVAYMSLLLSWPAFLLLEKLTPVSAMTPRSTYWLNWRITFSNLLLAPAFATLVVVFTIYVASATGLPSLEIAPATVSVGIPALDILLQGVVIFLTACFLGDFSYYWWHRLQHKVPFLWEIHKLHHSEEHLNATTIYRSHFFEPAGQSLVRGLTIGLIFDVHQAPESILAVVAGGLMLGLWDYFIHSNVRIDALHRLLPIFSTPQFHWIHHSRMPEHQDKNFSIWLPLYDIAFGSYYHPKVDEYPPTGLASGEKIDTVWEGQTAPFVAWARMLRDLFGRRLKERPH